MDRCHDLIIALIWFLCRLVLRKLIDLMSCELQCFDSVVTNV